MLTFLLNMNSSFEHSLAKLFNHPGPQFSHLYNKELEWIISQEPSGFKVFFSPSIQLL